MLFLQTIKENVVKYVEIHNYKSDRSTNRGTAPVEQIMMLERIVRHLKQLLLAQPATATPLKECKGIAEKLNQVYKAETSRLDSQLINAQCISVSRDEW